MSTTIYKVSKTFNAPSRYVYDWCTDLREDDNKISGSKREKKILERTNKRVVYVSNYPGKDGNQKVGVSIVTLKPPNSWHLEFIGQDDDEIGDYKVSRLGRERAKLDMTFKETWKNIPVIPTKEELVANSNRLWDKFVAALESDYSSTKQSK